MLKSPLVSTDWLEKKLADACIIPIDASWHMPDTGRSGPKEFFQGLIPGAIFFDIDQIADKSQNLPHTMPSEAAFASAVRDLGISNDDTLIIYEKSDIQTAARVWWMFRAMGHHKVFVLNGGFNKWQSEDKPVTTQIKEREFSRFTAKFDATLFRNTESLTSNLKSKAEQVIDARAANRFDGSVPEPRAGLKSGHIPGSQNLPFFALYKTDGTFKDVADIKVIMKTANIDLEAPITTSCGSGVTACNLAIAFAMLGKWDVAVYDGSWTEWGSNAKLPIEL